MKDLANNVNVTQSIVPIVLAADANGASADLQGYESATIILDVGIEGITLSTTNKIEFILQDSADNSTFAAVTSATSVTNTAVDSSGIFFTADGNADIPAVSVIGYVGGARYVRVVADFSGTHGTGTPVGATIVASHPRDSASTVGVS
tara:strand:+ start:2205 stop:2648 length:444 start_codon:yes stop_codon:yes gene_type:complete